MNITSNSPVSAAAGGFAGNSVTPFNYGACPCHAAVQRSRDLVAVQRSSTIAQADRVKAAIAQSKNIIWKGPASEEFRSRLDVVGHKIALLADDMENTHRLAWGTP